VLGTFRAALEGTLHPARPANADQFIARARELNRAVLASRPEVRPGETKEVPNRAGETRFVDPDLVEGTLRLGWSYIETLPEGFARAVFTMFLVAEVHPFADGNGRTARLMMNEELSAAGRARFLTPISYREDYLGALRALSRQQNAVPLPRMVLRILRWVPAVDWTSAASARAALEGVRAFDDERDALLRIA
jgi:hypothetical protein